MRSSSYDIRHGNMGTHHQSIGQVYYSCVLPAMTYAAETWALTSQAKNKLAAAQTKMERRMLNITYRDRKRNIWVREKTKVTDRIEPVRKREWTWAGRVSRIRDDRWTLCITSWKPYERKRPRGRPARRWRRTRQLLEGYHLAEDSATYTYWSNILRLSPNHGRTTAAQWWWW